MTDSIKKRGNALEGDYFRKQEELALQRMRARDESGEKPRLSPISGEPMTQRTYMGVVIDECPTSGGIFLDKGELEIIIEAIKKDDSNQKGFFAGLLNK